MSDKSGMHVNNFILDARNVQTDVNQKKTVVYDNTKDVNFGKIDVNNIDRQIQNADANKAIDMQNRVNVQSSNNEFAILNKNTSDTYVRKYDRSYLDEIYNKKVDNKEYITGKKKKKIENNKILFIVLTLVFVIAIIVSILFLNTINSNKGNVKNYGSEEELRSVLNI